MTRTEPRDQTIAVIHGNYHQRGGGEVVADKIAKSFNAPLYYGFGDEDAIPDDDIERIQLFDPGRLTSSIAKRVHQFRDACFMWWGQHLPELHEYDVIIQSGNEFGWYVPQDDQAIVKYVHSPPRGPYDMFHEHGDSKMHRAYSLAAKTLYRHTVSYPDIHLANSELVANRCRKYWGVDPHVLHPPVDVDEYGPENAEENQAGTFITFSRLYRHKRTREIVQAFQHLPEYNLIVGGDGPQREHLEDIASENVDVRGYLSEAEKRRLLAECDALIFNARNEDFGLVPIEAFASGTPVLGIRDGFTAAQIADGVNGLTFDRGQPLDIADAVAKYVMEGVTADEEELQAFAQQFSTSEFRAGLRDAVDAAQNALGVENIAEKHDWREADIDVELDPVAPDGGDA